MFALKEIPLVHTSSASRGDKHCGVNGKVFLVVSLAIGAVSWAPSARAQLNLFQGYQGPILTDEDVDARGVAVRKLLNDDVPSVGQTEVWTGPKTGNRGTLTIRQVFERSGLPCRSVASEVIYKQTQTTRRFELNACRVATGEWKIAE